MRLTELRRELGRAEYDFKDLVTAYSKHDIYLIQQTEGFRDWDNGGEWVDGEEIETLILPSAFLPLASDELRNDEGGLYNTQDRKLYTYDLRLNLNDLIKVDGIKYKLSNVIDYKEYDLGLRIFFAKRGEPDF